MASLRKLVRKFWRNRYRWGLDRPIINMQTKRLGSADCGWRFIDRPELYDSTIISCGLGEDASFDIEFAAHYGARVIIVDPTPAAVRHFDAIIARLGEPPDEVYQRGGRQPPSAYDMAAISDGQLQLVKKALWTEATTIRFFLPPNPAKQVSHSIINYLNRYSTSTPNIEVETITLNELLRQFNIPTLPLLKLDIEGAECPVIRKMLSAGIRPSQLLVEFDELNIPSRRGRLSFDDVRRALLSAGYQMAHFDGRANFVFALPP